MLFKQRRAHCMARRSRLPSEKLSRESSSVSAVDESARGVVRAAGCMAASIAADVKAATPCGARTLALARAVRLRGLLRLDVVSPAALFIEAE
jgi:hypothetical protein